MITLPPPRQSGGQLLGKKTGRIVLPKREVPEAPVKGPSLLTRAVGFAERNFPGTKQQVEGINSDPLNIEPTKGGVRSFVDKFGKALDISPQIIRFAKAEYEKPILTKAFRVAGTEKITSASDEFKQGLESVNAAAGLGFAPITGMIEAVNHLPIVGTITKATMLPFSVGAEALSGAAGAAVDRVPTSIMSQEVKDKVKPGIQEVASLVGMLLTGKALHVGTKKIGELRSKYGEKEAGAIVGKAEQIVAQQKAAEVKAAEPVAPAVVEPKQITLPKPETISREVKAVPEDIKLKRNTSLDSGLMGRDTESKPKGYDIIYRGEKVGTVGWEGIRDQYFRIADVRINENMRRKGIATATYDKIGSENKLEYWPSGSRMEDGTKFGNFYQERKLAAKENLAEVPPLPKGTGEVVTPTLATKVEANAVANSLTEGFGDLPSRQRFNMDDQSIKAYEIIDRDYEQAKRIAMGSEAPPPDVLPESVFVALEKRATKIGDVDTLRDLATKSNLTLEDSVLGARIRTLGERDPSSPVAAIEGVQEARVKATERNLGAKKIKEIKAKEPAEIKKEVTKAIIKKQTWADFAESIKC